jgi:hypothetical protein
MYLSTVDKGGEIVFPNAKVPNRFCVQVFRFWTVAVVEIKFSYVFETFKFTGSADAAFQSLLQWD